MKVRLAQHEYEYLRIPDRISAAKVSEKIRLPMRSSVNSRIDLDLTPYLLAPISKIGQPDVEWIFIVGPTQSGKSVFLQIAVADSIYQDPGPLLYLFPDRDSGSKQFREKIQDMVMATPELASHLTGRSRDVKNAEFILDHMTIKLGWGGSLGQMSSTSYKKAVLDELRLMPLMVGKESNAIKFATDRMTTYTHKGLSQGYGVSSPSVEGDLLHQQLKMVDTNVLVYKSQCPACGTYQKLNFFKNMYYDEGAKKALCLCVKCREAFPETNSKIDWNKNGVYAPIKVKVHKNGEVDCQIPKTSRYVYWWDSMVSPFRSFAKIQNEYLLTRSHQGNYKNFIQCWLAMFWKESISKTSKEDLEKKEVSNYKWRIVPDWTKVLLAGIDGQDNGFYVTVYAFAENRQHLVDAYFVACPIETASVNDVKEALKKQVMDRNYFTEMDTKWKPAFMGLDTGGHRTKIIYEACAELDRIVLMKGRNRQDSTSKRSRTEEAELWLIRTEEYLSETEKWAEPESNTLSLAEGTPYEFLSQYIRVEKVQTEDRKGNKIISWQKTGQCDYRFATCYCAALLDMNIESLNTTFRSALSEEGFRYNPLENFVKATEREAEEGLSPVGSNDGYDLGYEGDYWS